MRKFTFKWLLSLLVITGFAFNGNAQCDYSLRMIDSFGDGWNGNTMDVLVNGTVILDDVTLASGSDATEIFTVNTGDDVTTIWNGGGSYGYETSYEILDANATIVGSAAEADITTGTITGACPSCLAPTTLSAIVTPTTADLSWVEAGTATNWDVEWDVTGFVPTGTPTSDDLTVMTLNITGLTSGQAYDFYVRADCGSDNIDVSAWIGPYTFVYLEGANCAQAIAVSLPADFIADVYEDLSQTNAGLGNWNDTTSLGLYDGGEDIFYELTVATDMIVDVELDPKGTTYTGIGIYSSCPGNSNEVAQSTNSGGTAHGMSHLFLSAGTYYIMIDTWPSPDNIPDFDLTITNVIINTETDILTYSFTEETATVTPDAVNHTIDIEVGMGTDPTALVATFTLSNGATANVGGTDQVSAVTANTFVFDSPFTYNVVAEDGTTNQDWVITVSEAAGLSSEKDIITFSFPEENAPATINAATQTVDIEVDWLADITNLTPTIAISGLATINPLSGVAQDFSSAFIYTVTAEDATTLDWTVNVTLGAAPAGANCTEALPIALPADFVASVYEDLSQTNVGLGNWNDTTSLGSYDGGEDIFYELTIASDMTVNVELDPKGTTYTGIGIYSSCPGSTNEVAQSTNGSAGIHGMDNLFLAAGTYFIMIDTWPSPANIPDFDLTITQITCPDPSNLSVSGQTDTQADLAWTAGGSETMWDIEYGATPFTPTGTATNDNVVNPFTLTGLTAETSYEFYVRADCSGDDSDVSMWVGPFAFSTTAACPAPTDLTATVTDVTADLSWNGYSATEFDIEWDVTGFAPTGTPTIENTTDNPYALTGLTAGTGYDYYVRADCGAEQSAWVGPFTFTTLNVGDDCSLPLTAVIGMNSADNSGGTQWFEYTATTDDNLTVTSCTYTTEDTRLRVFSDCPATTQVAYNDDGCSTQSTATFAITTGTTYYISWEDAYTSGTFDFELLFPLSAETDIVTYSFSEETATVTPDAVNHTVDIEVVNGTDVSNIVPTFTLSTGATTTQATNDFTLPVVYNVVAEDGTTNQDWTVTVTVNPSLSAETDILTYSFAEETATVTPDAVNHTVDIEVVNGTDVSNIVPTFTLSAGATTTQATNDFTLPVVYNVIAQDGTTNQDWTVTVTIAPALSTEAEVLTFTIPSQESSDIFGANDSISVVMPTGTDVTALVADFTLSAMANAAVGATAQVSGATPNDWTTNPVVYNVTAEDGTTVRSWNVYVTVADGINNVIDSKDVTVYPNPNNGQFNIALNLKVNTVNMEVVNMQGQVVANFNNVEANTTQSIDLNNVAKGVYYIRVSTEKDSIIKKVVIK